MRLSSKDLLAGLSTNLRVESQLRELTVEVTVVWDATAGAKQPVFDGMVEAKTNYYTLASETIDTEEVVRRHEAI